MNTVVFLNATWFFENLFLVIFSFLIICDLVLSFPYSLIRELYLCVLFYITRIILILLLFLTALYYTPMSCMSVSTHPTDSGSRARPWKPHDMADYINIGYRWHY